VQNRPDPFENAPAEVIAFLRDVKSPRSLEPRIGLLTLDQSRRYSGALQEFPVGQSLGLIALNDANHSNPFCYISRGIARGMVVHFSHDPEPELRFPDLESFRHSLATVVQDGRDIDELPGEPLRPHKDQQELARTLAEFTGRNDGDTEFLICLLVPLLAPDQAEVIDRLANHESFFVRERTAKFIASHPHPGLRPVAERLALDSHPQVARPGKEALSRVNREHFQKKHQSRRVRHAYSRGRTGKGTYLLLRAVRRREYA
jgi:hypothetical protein